MVNMECESYQWLIEFSNRHLHSHRSVARGERIRDVSHGGGSELELAMEW